MLKLKKYKVELVTVEPFRIGGIRDPISGVDNPVTKVGDKLAVPGPSLKGALRAEIEKYLIDTYWNASAKRWADGKSDFQPCIPASKFTADEESLIRESKYRKAACHYPCFKRPCPAPAREGESAHTICPVCYFMGAMGLAGFVRVPFLFSDISGSELYSARMDRAIKTVVEGTNRPYQLVPDGAKFIGELQIITEDSVLGWRIGEPRPLLKKTTLGDKWLEGNPIQSDAIIDTYIIQRLKTVNLLGGYKSKGFGQVKITVTEIK